MFEKKNRFDTYECERFESYEENEASINENESTVMKLKIEMIIAETRSFAKNMTDEITVADATSLNEIINLDSLDSFDEMMLAETKSFVENTTVEMTSADAVSFDEIMNFDLLDSFDKMMFAETKSFDEINSDSFLF